jgi:hypothetical protein
MLIEPQERIQPPMTANHAAAGEGENLSSAVFEARFWLERTPWRVAGGWSLLAGLLAGGVGQQPLIWDWVLIALLFVLVDLLWGSIWGALTVPASLPRVTTLARRSRVWLPYLQPGSPASRLLGMDGPGLLPVIARIALPSMVLALLISSLFGSLVLGLTGAVLLISLAGWIHRQVAFIPLSALHSLVAVLLPWVVGLHYTGALNGDAAWLLALALLWTAHQWGAVRCLNSRRDPVGMGVLATTQVAICLLLVWVQIPLWVGLLSLLFLPTWLLTYRQRSLESVQFWWLAAMLFSGYAVSQILVL